MEQSLGRRKIQSINGLKAFAILSVFWQYCNITILPFDMGARTCEFLFVASGFLVAYNHFDRGLPSTWTESLRYTCEKLIRMWPLHVLTFLRAMKNHKYLLQIVFTFPEGIAAIGVLYAMWKMDAVWMRADFVLLFSFVVFLFAFAGGVALSSVFTKTAIRFASKNHA